MANDSHFHLFNCTACTLSSSLFFCFCRSAPLTSQRHYEPPSPLHSTSHYIAILSAFVVWFHLRVSIQHSTNLSVNAAILRAREIHLRSRSRRRPRNRTLQAQNILAHLHPKEPHFTPVRPPTTPYSATVALGK